MCGAFVSVRKCSSARFGSGTAKKRDSRLRSAVASRNPKIAESDFTPCAFDDVKKPAPPKLTSRREQIRKRLNRVVMRLLGTGHKLVTKKTRDRARRLTVCATPRAFLKSGEDHALHIPC